MGIRYAGDPLTGAPRFSVLLPTHNRSGVLNLAIDTVLSQGFEDFELLVVGDGCTDDTADVVRAFGDERIVWYDLPKGPHFGYANRNAALKEARGELVAFMAHDDLWFVDHLESFSDVFADESLDLAYSMPLWIDPEGAMAPMPFNLHDPELRGDFIARRRNLLPAVNVVYRRRCHSRVGLWNEQLESCGDWDLWARIISSGGTDKADNFIYLPKPTCLHFRAIWRREPLLVPKEELAFNQIRRIFPHWDRALRVDCSGSAEEQEAAWRVIRAGGEAWLARLRADVACFLDRRNIDLDVYHDAKANEAASLDRESPGESQTRAAVESS